MRKIKLIIGIVFLTIFLSSCGDGSDQKESEYDTTKKMVVDILQTEEGRKALRDLITDDKMKQELVIESDVVQNAIDQVLVSEKGQTMWKDLFKDPTFIEGFAESIRGEQEKLMKSLMNDAEYQKQMLDLLQNPEINEQILELMKSQQFRSHLEETIGQTLETPLFQAKMTELLLKAAEEQAKGKEQKESGSEEGENAGDQSQK